VQEKRYLLHELRLEHDKELDEKRNLDSKSSTLAGYSVTFNVLLFGFGAFLLEKIETTDKLVSGFTTSLLIIGVVLAIICVIFAVHALRLRDYRYVILDFNFFPETKLPDDREKWHEYLNNEEIQSWIKDFPKQEDYEDFMIKQHLVALRNNRLSNDDKAKWIRYAHPFFISAVCIIPAILVLVLMGVLMGTLTIDNN
jgi:hypothetical protein